MKKSFLKSRAQNEDMSLQITSMADIFIIILVFLLKSYATGLTVSPTKGMKLPSGVGQDAAVEALKVEVSADAIQVEGQPVVLLRGYKFESTDLQQNGSSAQLGKALERERQRQLLIAKANSDVKVDAKIMILADQKAPYSTIKSVLATAAVNGYTDFKLAVVKGD